MQILQVPRSCPALVLVSGRPASIGRKSPLNREMRGQRRRCEAGQRLLMEWKDSTIPTRPGCFFFTRSLAPSPKLPTKLAPHRPMINVVGAYGPRRVAVACFIDRLARNSDLNCLATSAKGGGTSNFFSSKFILHFQNKILL